MLNAQVFKVVQKASLPKGAKILSNTWAMKKKSSGVYRARLVARGYEQISGKHYDEDSISGPVVSDITIMVVLVLITLGNLYAGMLDVKGAFLLGILQEELYMKIPQGFEDFYKDDVVLKLERTLYGTKQAAYEFWKETVESMESMGCGRNKADPCLYFKWVNNKLLMWMSWIDDYLYCGQEQDALQARDDMKKRFECDDVGPLEEFVGCKIEWNKEERWMRLTQPVLLQSFKDEFDLPIQEYSTLAPGGQVLKTVVKEEDQNSEEEHARYQSGVGKMMHMMRRSRPEISNAVRDLSRFMMQKTGPIHIATMKQAMKYCTDTPN